MGAIQSSGWAIFVWPYLVLAQLLGEKRLQVVIYYVRIIHVYQTFLSFWIGPFPCRRCTEFSKTIGLTMRSVQVFLSIENLGYFPASSSLSRGHASVAAAPLLPATSTVVPTVARTTDIRSAVGYG